VISMNGGYEDVLHHIASDSPTPGGGSVAALSLAHAHALASMVARLTLGKEIWQSGHESANHVLSESSVGLQTALTLAHRDAESFQAVMQAFRLPKSGDDEVSTRKAAIMDAYIIAASVPLETTQNGLGLLLLLDEMAMSCNANAITDLAASAELANTAIIIAGLNVRINLQSLPDVNADAFSSELADVEEQASSLIGRIRATVEDRMR